MFVVNWFWFHFPSHCEVLICWHDCRPKAPISSRTARGGGPGVYQNDASLLYNTVGKKKTWRNFLSSLLLALLSHWMRIKRFSWVFTDAGRINHGEASFRMCKQPHPLALRTVCPLWRKDAPSLTGPLLVTVGQNVASLPVRYFLLCEISLAARLECFFLFLLGWIICLPGNTGVFVCATRTATTKHLVRKH